MTEWHVSAFRKSEPEYAFGEIWLQPSGPTQKQLYEFLNHHVQDPENWNVIVVEVIKN